MVRPERDAAADIPDRQHAPHDAARRTINAARLKLLLLAALFLGPLVGAWLFYQYGAGLVPSATTNKGELLSPARPLDQVELRGLDGSLLNADLFRGRWTLLFVAGPDCDDDCLARIYESRQVHTALGRRRARVQRVLVLTDAPPPALRDTLAEIHPDLKVTLARGDDDPFLQFLSLYATEDVVAAGRLYVLDPLGNWLMYYGPEKPARHLLDDLKRLLKLSQIG